MLCINWPCSCAMGCCQSMCAADAEDSDAAAVTRAHRVDHGVTSSGRLGPPADSVRLPLQKSVSLSPWLASTFFEEQHVPSASLAAPERQKSRVFAADCGGNCTIYVRRTKSAPTLQRHGISPIQVATLCSMLAPRLLGYSFQRADQASMFQGERSLICVGLHYCS